MRARTIVIGDIHGCYDELVHLLGEVKFGGRDRVISTGDLIVKGEKNRQVLDLFMSDERFSAVVGNHDMALRRRWNGEDVALKPAQKDAFKQLRADKELYARYLNEQPFMIDLGSHLVVHAGLRPNVALHSQSTDDLIELRTLGADRESHHGTPWYEQYNGDKTIIFGHWVSTEPRRGRKAIGLDTGCVYGGRLTAYIVETGELKSVPARRSYCD